MNATGLHVASVQEIQRKEQLENEMKAMEADLYAISVDKDKGSSRELPDHGGIFNGEPVEVNIKVTQAGIYADENRKQPVPLDKAINVSSFPLFVTGLFYDGFSNIINTNKMRILGWKLNKKDGSIHLFSDAKSWIRVMSMDVDYMPSTHPLLNYDPSMQVRDKPQSLPDSSSESDEDLISRHLAGVSSTQHKTHAESKTKRSKKGALLRDEEIPVTVEPVQKTKRLKKMKDIYEPEPPSLEEEKEVEDMEEDSEEDGEPSVVYIFNNGWGGEPVSEDDPDDEDDDDESGEGEVKKKDEGDVEDDNEEEGDEDEQEEMPNEMVCGVCDDGGDLIQCDGICMRSFHRQCVGLHKAEYNRIKKKSEQWKCHNCLLHIHQCFYCKDDGLTSKDSAKSELFYPRARKLGLVLRCSLYECGRFYHRDCLRSCGIRLQTDDFICPRHYCKKCGKLEHDHSPDGELIKCRRCVNSFHKNCIPENLRDFDPAFPGLDILRLWTPIGKPIHSHFANAYAGRAKEWAAKQESDQVSSCFLYCTTHKLEPSIQAPIHTRPIFSRTLIDAALKFLKMEKSKQPSSQLQSPIQIPKSSGFLQDSREKFQMMDRSGGAKLPTTPGAAPSTGALIQEDTQRSKKMAIWQRLSAVEEWSMKLLNMEKITAPLVVPAPYDHSLQTKITDERLDMLLHTAKIAKQNKNPLLITHQFKVQVQNYQTELQVRMNPFRHKNKYSSYGRHFTVPSKLEMVTDHLCFFLRRGDWLVDFSCGSNEFLLMLERKLITEGPYREGDFTFRGYDILPARFHQHFEMINWFSVQQKMLTNGDKLVIGLNPPFGVNNKLAVRFIAHSLKFNPRIIVLIVPPSTALPTEFEHQHKYRPPQRKYKVVHRNNNELSGQSFFFPGSFQNETGDNVADWNKTPPSFIILQRIDSLDNTQTNHWHTVM